ncbi:carbohydrate-binding module family 13 protein [Ramaria rubella]|nr:carbohydrate-binding module family 13 protein [Ramaria rubella]
MVAVFVALAAVVFGGVNAITVPTPGEVFQIQPTFRGSFPRTPCVTVFDAANGSAAVINDCSASTEQRGFQIVPVGGGPFAQLTIFNTFCLGVTGSDQDNGAKVTISSCVENDDLQTWVWTDSGIVEWGHFIKMCLDLTNGDETNGNQLQIWECNFDGTNPNQLWTSAPLANPITNVVNTGVEGGDGSGLCMAADDSANGSPVFVAPCDDTTSLKVWSVPQPGHGDTGSYQLAFGPDDSAPIKCLDVINGVNAPGTKLQLWDCTDGPNQQWLPDPANIRWDGISQQFPMCVDLTNGVTTRGNQLQIWNCTAGPNQAWADVAPVQTAT